MTWFGIKWPKKGWYTVKQNTLPTNLHRLFNTKDILVEQQLWFYLKLEGTYLSQGYEFESECNIITGV